MKLCIINLIIRDAIEVPSPKAHVLRINAVLIIAEHHRVPDRYTGPVYTLHLLIHRSVPRYEYVGLLDMCYPYGRQRVASVG